MVFQQKKAIYVSLKYMKSFLFRECLSTYFFKIIKLLPVYISIACYYWRCVTIVIMTSVSCSVKTNTNVKHLSSCVDCQSFSFHDNMMQHALNAPFFLHIQKFTQISRSQLSFMQQLPDKAGFLCDEVLLLLRWIHQHLRVDQCKHLSCLKWIVPEDGIVRSLILMCGQLLVYSMRYNSSDSGFYFIS